MATARRRADAALSERLFQESHRFGFFQAVRLLQTFAPGRTRVGEAGPPAEEPVRFAAEPSLSFPASEIYEITREESGAARMIVRFMGLTGPQGTLPRHYTNLIIERLRRRDRALADFLDLFNHRLVSLFFRVWAKYRPHFRITPDGTDELSRGLFSLFGLGTAGLGGRLAVRDRSLLFYTGLLAQRPSSATGLAGLLADYFEDVPVEIEQFVGQWLRLDPESRTRLIPFRGNTQLGTDAIIGDRVWHTQSKFRVRLGPMTYSRLCTFLPSGTASREALDLTRFYVGLGFDFEFRLVLQADEVRTTELGSRGPEATRLGWSTWLAARGRTTDADDVAFNAETIVAYQDETREDAA